MNIIVSKYRGFCNGVTNAVNAAIKTLKQCPEGTVYSYGEIVHNETVVENLRKLGLRVVDDTSTLKKGDTLIIRSHGAPPDVFDYCKRNEINVVDATCPFVKNIQTKARDYFLKGYQIVLVGNRLHPEIIGINGWCQNSAIVFSGDEKIVLKTNKNVLVLFQTTFDNEKVEKTLKNVVSIDAKILEFFNTICYTTIYRQRFAEYSSVHSDFCVVVGGKHSSNTAKLFAIAKANNANTIWIESADELPNVSEYESIGLIAGASTPIELTEEVLSKMIQDAKDNAKVLEQQDQQVEQVVDQQPVQDEPAKETVSARSETEQELFTRAVEKLDKGPRQFKKGQKVKGEIVQIAPEGVFVSLGTKKEAVIPNDQISLEEDVDAVKASLKIGDKVECIVLSTDKGVTLSKKQIDELYKDDEQVEGIKAGNRFEVTIKSDVKGGLLAKLGSFTVFVPASHVKVGFANDLKQFVGKKMSLVALPDGIDETKRKIVASHKVILEQEKKEREDNFWNNIEVGEIVEGKVLRFASFGAFVNVRGMDCLAHLSDLAWTSVTNPAEVLEIGKTYEFVVLKLDRETNRISIGYKQLQPHPWQLAAEKYAPGTVVTGKVARILPYGAFVELGDGIDGLLHISNISWEWLQDINKAVKIGDELELQVIECDVENKRITLSRKALLEQPEVSEQKSSENETTVTETPDVEEKKQDETTTD